ncbi:DUF2848 family protein [Peribacillus glennii]|uniref:DUF2848 domain-containing protein n=1 Tax=Peribacillus glennii TaxID=2303991 RepID=A0A372LG09_9BACI|nr:DUF2848 family protein [Peribacillus glennii]RFU64944.1 DUF2848 domain-containing protein [Peribacillus glennii]
MKIKIDGNLTNWVPKRLVIAGYTAKDQEAAQKHIDELKELGVPAPPRIPMLYDLSPGLLTSEPSISVVNNDSSGEVELILLDLDGTWYVGLGSDHTDRVLEAVSIQKSKQVCPKPISQDLWLLSEIEGHMDQLEMRSWVTVNGEESLYQEGRLESFLSPKELLKIVDERGYSSSGLALYCGTPPIVNGEFIFGEAFRAELTDPILERKITLSYKTDILKIAEEE